MRKSKKLKPTPKFESAEEEREFWASHDTTEYFDTTQPIKLDLSELKPSTKTITIRLPESLWATLKSLAHKRDVPYQSLLKVFLAEKTREELIKQRA